MSIAVLWCAEPSNMNEVKHRKGHEQASCEDASPSSSRLKLWGVEAARRAPKTIASRLHLRLVRLLSPVTSSWERILITFILLPIIIFMLNHRQQCDIQQQPLSLEQTWQRECEAARRDVMQLPPSANNNDSLRGNTKSKSNNFPESSSEKSTVVACTIAIHEQPYITEWAEYNLHVLNVAKLYVYDNAPIPELSDWTVEGQNGTSSRISVIHRPGDKQQGPAYKDCARRALSEGYEYAFFTDVDEFLVLYRHDSIMELAVDYLGKEEDVHALVEVDHDRKVSGSVVSDMNDSTTKANSTETRTVGSLGMNFRVLGNNCDISYKPLPVSKRFQYRVSTSYPMNAFIKSLVKLKWLDLDVEFTDPHFYKLKDHEGKEAVKIDTDRHVRGGSMHHTPLYDVAAVHHYLFKSLNEYIKKRERGGGTTGTTNMKLIENAKRGIDNFGNFLPGGNVFDDEVWRRLVERVPRYKKFDEG